MKEKVAKGTKGVLLISNGYVMFRVYHDKYDEGFRDFDVGLSDMSIIIDDEDAFFKGDNLDYSDATLGR